MKKQKLSKILHIKADNTNVKLDVDLIYPVGSIYMSINNVNPTNYFGGTWEQIKDTFLLGSGSYTLGDTGGEKEHTLTVGEMPKHNHDQNARVYGYGGWESYTTNSYGVIIDWSTSNYHNPNTTLHTTTVDGTCWTNNVGGSQSHNNMPPYLVVNIWKRTA